MAWVPIQSSGLDFSFNSGTLTLGLDSQVVAVGSSDTWQIQFAEAGDLVIQVRITANYYEGGTNTFPITNPAEFQWTDPVAGVLSQSNEITDGETLDFSPSPLLLDVTGDGYVEFVPANGTEWTVPQFYAFLIEVQVDAPVPPQPVKRTKFVPFAVCSEFDTSGKERMLASFVGLNTNAAFDDYVYELDVGWGFDGQPIEHYLEFNWNFGTSPVNFSGVQKVRVYGRSQGAANLTFAARGQEQEFGAEYTEPQHLGLPRSIIPYVPFYNSTDIVNLANRGLSIQLKLEGDQSRYSAPIVEPSHVIQVLVIEQRPDNRRDT